MDYAKVNVMDEVKAIKVWAPAEKVDDLQNNCNYEAAGDAVLLVDTDQLDNSESPVAEEILKALPDDFVGLVYIVCE